MIGSLPRGERTIIFSSLAFLTAAAWMLIRYAHSGAGEPHRFILPHAISFGPGALFVGTLLWLTMMVAMMLPAIWPWILILAADETKPAVRPYGRVAAFLAGYFAVWTLFSLAAAAAQLALQRGTFLHGTELRLGVLTAGAVLLGAGVFQLTPLKAACLKHCRTPLGFFLSYWRGGSLGAFEMGFRHGTVCLVCCWALMALSFALGVMNLLWMAALTVIICSERLLPRGQELGRAFGFALLSFGAWMIVTGLAA